MRHAPAAALLLLVASTTVVRADLAPVGPAFQVNSYTTNVQYQPDVTATTAGEFVVVWASFYQETGGTQAEYSGLFGRRLTSKGAPIGGEFQVNVYTPGYQYQPSVEPLPGGGFVVAWTDYGEGRDQFRGFDPPEQTVLRRFASDATPLGGDFVVSEITTGDVFEAPALSTNAAGDILVSWAFEAAGPNPRVVLAQRLSSTGTPLGPNFSLSTVPADARYPASASLADDSFVVVWRDRPDSLNQAVMRRVSSTGAALGTTMVVAADTSQATSAPDVAPAADGGFLVAWQGNSDVGPAIVSRRFDSSGAAAGGDIVVSSYSTSGPTDPALGVAPDGFYAVWSKQFDVIGRNLSDTGVPVSPEVDVGTDVNQGGAKLATLPSGAALAVWENSDDGDGKGIRAQLLADGIFGDDFEGGDAAAWSSIVPAPCVDDGAEEDDICALGPFLTVDAPAVSRNHCDADWVNFNVSAGKTYVIETSNLAGGADTRMRLFVQCGVSVFADDEDGGVGLASRIQFTTFAPGFLSVEISRTDGGYGAGQSYDVDVTCTDC